MWQQGKERVRHAHTVSVVARGDVIVGQHIQHRLVEEQVDEAEQWLACLEVHAIPEQHDASDDGHDMPATGSTLPPTKTCMFLPAETELWPVSGCL